MKLTRLTIREYAESLVIAFVMALIIRHYVVEAFRIPTASMQPTLIGNESQGDRILVSKFQYDLHPPRRWDVIVFKIDEHRIAHHRQEAQRRPRRAKANLNGTLSDVGIPEYVNYVKRLVGLPGETIQVIDGDLFIDNRLCRKPDRVQDALLVPVTSDRILEQTPRNGFSGPRGVGFFERWSRTPPDGVALDGKVLLFKGANPGRECTVRYQPDIKDQIPGERRLRAHNPVGDLHLAFRFRYRAGDGVLRGRLTKDETAYAFALPLGWPDARPKLLLDDEVVAEAAESFQPTGEHTLTFQNIDARMVLRVDGRELVSYALEDPAYTQADALLHNRTDQSRVRFGVEGCDVAVRDVAIWRDIYYTTGSDSRFAVNRSFQLGPDEYFVLGDNSPNSFDSRNWGVVEGNSLIGEAFFVFWPIPRWKFIN